MVVGCWRSSLLRLALCVEKLPGLPGSRLSTGSKGVQIISHHCHLARVAYYVLAVLYLSLWLLIGDHQQAHVVLRSRYLR